METAAFQPDTDCPEWQVTNDGTALASIVTRREGGSVVVTAQILGGGKEAERIRPYRFNRTELAEAFVRDLVASFSYLGCHVTTR